VATALAWVVLALPLLSGIILTGWPTEPPQVITRLLGIGSILISFALTLTIFIGMLGNPADDRTFTSSAYQWIDIGGLSVDLSILVDPLSVMMMLIITGVGFLIHLYSAEYMDHDRDYRRFFACMNLFVFAMLLLVLAANFFFLIVGWAFVGLASYLLIGFWYERPTAVAAAKKAFVVNVIGDVGLVLAAFLILRQLGTLDYAEAFANADKLGPQSGMAAAVCLLLFVGAAAKSAQVPLHTWLPDAMEGPTPVSALIHAATMVTAGVYLIVRCHAFFDISWVAADVVTVVGAITLLMAATVALQQVDIKRVLAWSTVSQVGYMVMAVGLGAYASGMFMLMAHAFYKAALFLAAGIIIHALNDEQSLDRMGGLRKYLRVAYFGMAAGCLAIAGIPGFSGFFAKDDVLSSALTYGGGIGTFAWIVGIIGAFLTALYMFRLLFRAFFGPGPAGGYNPKPHPSRWWMSVPVVILGILSIVGGWLQVPFGWTGIGDWLDPVLGTGPEIITPTHTAEVITMSVAVVMAIAGIALAWWLFGADPERRIRLARIAQGPRGVMRDAWRFDEAYDDILVDPSREVADVMLTKVEPAGPQGLITGTTTLVRDTARVVSASQSGLVRSYVFWMVLGLSLAGIVIALVVAGGA
jgi:NADH-quinone oxidoreductase subunit L